MSLSLRGSGLDVKHTEDGIVVRFSRCPSLDAGVIDEVGGQLLRLVEAQRPRLLLLDFADVRYLGAAGLGTLLGVNKRLEETGGRLVLTNLSHHVYELFEITRLDTVLDIRTGAEAEPRCHLSA
jgi:anti-anti-sigma factor